MPLQRRFQSVVWVAVSFVFVAWLWWYLGGTAADRAARELANTKALEFVTGHLVEKALAVDNIFVFLMLFTYFAVPAEFQKRVLMIGVLGALVLRAVMILIGAWLISQFHWIALRLRRIPRLHRDQDVVGRRRCARRPRRGPKSSPPVPAAIPMRRFR
jgi:hypothetical protein